MSSCASCRRETPALIVLTSPRGEYGLCSRCMNWPEPPALPALQKGKRR